MSFNDTYESTDRNSSLERYEWDDIWHEQTDLNDKFRIFYIGDSISRGIRRRITALSGGEMLCSGYATSKAADNAQFCDMIKISLSTCRCDAILFNNGLHGWHLSEDEYAKHYDGVVKYIINNFDVPLYILTTTKTTDTHSARVIKRNEEAKRIAEGYGLRIIDLYSESSEISEHIKDDGVHFDDEGYDNLAKFIIENLK